MGYADDIAAGGRRARRVDALRAHLARPLLAVFFIGLALALAGCASADGSDTGEDDVAVESSDALTVRSDEWAFFDRMNTARKNHGKKPLRMQPGLVRIARAWSNNMLTKNRLYHRANLTQRVEAVVTTHWTRIGENVGVGGSVPTLHQAFMNSPEHRANILGDYDYVGIGAATESDGTIWVTVDFLKSPASLTTVKE